MTAHLDGQGVPAHFAGGVGPERGCSPASCGVGGALETRLALVAAPLWVQGMTAVLDAAARQSRSALLTTRPVSPVPRCSPPGPVTCRPA